MKALVSIIIPTYNRAHLLGETLESVLAQTYENWECIVVDDGSIDATDELMEFYCEKDFRIQYHHRPINRPKGANACRNYGFELSKGEYVNWLDSDDILSKNKIQEQIQQLLKCDITTIATCRWQTFIKKIKEPDSQNDFRVYRSFNNILEFIDALALSGGFLPPHAYLVSRELICQAGNWMENLTINQDGEFFVRIFIKTKQVVFINNTSVYYRKNNDDNVSQLNNELKIAHAILSWQLIESYFKIRFGESTRLVSISKKYLYERIFKVNRKLIKEHQLFFEDEILRNKFSLIRKSKKLIKRILRKAIKRK
jgi:glycosyltransferase involved in cell wall biosynthesis